jgi:hypothetical protein
VCSDFARFSDLEKSNSRESVLELVGSTETKAGEHEQHKLGTTLPLLTTLASKFGLRNLISSTPNSSCTAGDDASLLRLIRLNFFFINFFFDFIFVVVWHVVTKAPSHFMKII